MKSKLLLLILCFSIVFFGCKKEKNPEDQLANAKKQIIGTWQVQSSVYTYYDASGKVVDTENAELDDDLTFQFLDATTLKSSNSDDSNQYTLTNVDGKIMVNVSGQSFEVKINNGTMTWSLEQQFQDEAYTKAIYNIQFKKL